MDTTLTATRSEHFQALLEAGLAQKVAEKLDNLYVAGEFLGLFELQGGHLMLHLLSGFSMLMDTGLDPIRQVTL